MSVIQIDSRQKANQKHHKRKEDYFLSKGHTVVHSKMLIGDYQIVSDGSIVVDTKQSCGELYQDLIQDHQRFKRECILAKDCGVKLHVLVESKEGFKSVDDFRNWSNPRFFVWKRERNKAIKHGKPSPKAPASNVQLIKIMNAMHRDYGVNFWFVPEKDAGKAVLCLLGVEDG